MAARIRLADNIIANADKFGGVVGENLRKALDWLPTGRELITIKCDLDSFEGMPASFESLMLQSQDKVTLAELYDRFDFKTWQRELATETPAATPVLASGETGSLFDAPNSNTKASVSDNTKSSTSPHIAVPKIEYQAITTRHFETILTNEHLDTWLAKLQSASLICVDTETTSLEPMTAKIVGLSFSVEAGSGA